MSRPAWKMPPAVCVSSPAMMRSRVVLPQPEGPRKQTNSPCADRQVDVGQRLEGAERLADALQAQVLVHGAGRLLQRFSDFAL